MLQNFLPRYHRCIPTASFAALKRMSSIAAGTMNNSLLAQTVIFLEISLHLAERAPTLPRSQRMPSVYSNCVPVRNMMVQPERSARVGRKERAVRCSGSAQKSESVKSSKREERGKPFARPKTQLRKSLCLARPGLDSEALAFAKAPGPSLTPWIRGRWLR